MADLVGETFGSYQLTERIGRGGMAEVYKALHTSLAVFRALKVIRPELVLSDDFRARFLKEAQSVAQLKHPNIVQVHDFGTHNSMYFMVMEFVEGSDLKKLLQREGPIRPIERAISLMLPIARALEYAHKRGLVHRDIKPDNIVLNESGEPILMDFGIAKLVTGGTQLTQTGMAIGTPEYMAPEQALGTSEVGPATDQYSLCVVLFELLTGRVPFTAETPVGVAIKTINDPLPSPQSLSPDIGDELQSLLLKGTAKRVADRYDSVTSLRHALESLISRGAQLSSSGTLALTAAPGATLLRPTGGSTAPVVSAATAPTTFRHTAPVTAASTAPVGTVGPEHPTHPALHTLATAAPAPKRRMGVPLAAALVLGVAVAGAAGYWVVNKRGDGAAALTSSAGSGGTTSGAATAPTSSVAATETGTAAAAQPPDTAARNTPDAGAKPAATSPPRDATASAQARGATPKESARQESAQPTGPGVPLSAAGASRSQDANIPPPPDEGGDTRSAADLIPGGALQGDAGYAARNRQGSSTSGGPGFGVGQAQADAAARLGQNLAEPGAAGTLALQQQRVARASQGIPGGGNVSSQLAGSRLIPQGVIPGQVGNRPRQNASGGARTATANAATNRAVRGQTTQQEVMYRFGEPDLRRTEQSGRVMWHYQRNLSDGDIRDNTFAAQIATGLNDFFRPASRGRNVRTIGVTLHFDADDNLIDFTANATYD